MLLADSLSAGVVRPVDIQVYTCPTNSLNGGRLEGIGPIARQHHPPDSMYDDGAAVADLTGIVVV